MAFLLLPVFKSCVEARVTRSAYDEFWDGLLIPRNRPALLLIGAIVHRPDCGDQGNIPLTSNQGEEGARLMRSMLQKSRRNNKSDGAPKAAAYLKGTERWSRHSQVEIGENKHTEKNGKSCFFLLYVIIQSG